MDSISESQNGCVAGQSHHYVQLLRRVTSSYPGPGNPQPLIGAGLWGTKNRIDLLTHSITPAGEKGAPLKGQQPNY